MRIRQVLVTVTVIGLAVASLYVFWTPTQRIDLVIPPVGAPPR
jgi:hypothetical protein